MADIFVVNKADRAGAADARRDLEYMLDLGHGDGWRPPVALTVATTGEGADELFKHVQDHRHHLRTSSAGAERRLRGSALASETMRVSRKRASRGRAPAMTLTAGIGLIASRQARIRQAP